ncbi:MAG: DUF4115 domain-containing protein, partial [Alphaproteobacteria bacterium]|nr:DUF4115 domain-containing protein [Alphaproteobacteria bacterium]
PAKLAVAPPPVMGPVPPGAAIPQAVPGVQAIAAPLDPATAAASSATSAAVATATAAPQRQELMIRVLETAWVEVRGPDGRALLSRVLKPGDTYTVPPGPEMVLDTGNIGGLEFVLNGNVLPPLGAKGDVRRKISLDPAKLAPMQAGATPVSPRTDADTAATISPAAGGE